jgi:hypothetical protein
MQTMSLLTTRRPRRGVLAAALTAGVLLGGSLAVTTAHAAIACRSDPVVVVNGATVDIIDTLSTTASAVRELDYTITVPKGSVIGQTTLTVGLGFPEKVTYVFRSSQAWGTLKVTATVQVQPGTPAFQTTLQATSPSSPLALTSTASGLSTSPVTVALKNLVMI